LPRCFIQGIHGFNFSHVCLGKVAQQDCGGRHQFIVAPGDKLASLAQSIIPRRHFGCVSAGHFLERGYVFNVKTVLQ